MGKAQGCAHIPYNVVECLYLQLVLLNDSTHRSIDDDNALP